MTHPTADLAHLFEALQAASGDGIVAARPRTRRAYLRWSPHFYNTEEELDRAAGILRAAL